RSLISIIVACKKSVAPASGIQLQRFRRRDGSRHAWGVGGAPLVFAVDRRSRVRSRQRFRGHSFLGGSQHLFEAWVIPDQVEVRVYLGVMNQTSAHLFECWSKHL